MVEHLLKLSADATSFAGDGKTPLEASHGSSFAGHVWGRDKGTLLSDGFGKYHWRLGLATHNVAATIVEQS